MIRESVNLAWRLILCYCSIKSNRDEIRLNYHLRLIQRLIYEQNKQKDALKMYQVFVLEINIYPPITRQSFFIYLRISYSFHLSIYVLMFLIINSSKLKIPAETKYFSDRKYDGRLQLNILVQHQFAKSKRVRFRSSSFFGYQALLRRKRDKHCVTVKTPGPLSFILCGD